MLHRNRRAPLPLIILPVALFLGACGDGSPTEPLKEIEGLPRDLSFSEQLLVDAGNDFSFRLLGQLFGEAPDSNLFVSPLSASVAPGMTLNGAAGSTFEEMRGTLGFGDLTMDEIDQAYRDLIDLLLNLDPTVEMAIGNSIWYREGFPVRTDFLDRTRSYFGAEVAALDFTSPSAPVTINDWVKASTKGKIAEIVDSPIDPAVVMYLINAIYFKGSWTYRFDKGKTAQAPFSGLSGSSASVPLMELEGELLYDETDEYQVLDLPYGGKAFSMTVLLPRAGHPLQEIVASLDPGGWSRITGSLRESEGTVYLPRFRLEWERLLNEALRAMGMQTPFDPAHADFSGLANGVGPGDLFISKVKQKSYVDVNEEGTEAAAATSVEIELTAVPTHFTFRADRPFLFVIRERFSQAILFAGVLVEAPEA